MSRIESLGSMQEINDSMANAKEFTAEPLNPGESMSKGCKACRCVCRPCDRPPPTPCRPPGL